MSDELKHCPFCGGSATIGGLVPWAECTACEASGSPCTDEASAAAAWNRRVDPQPPAEAQPVAWQFQDRKGNWHEFIDERHRLNTIEDGSWPIRALYAHPPPSASVGVEDEPIDASDNAEYIERCADKLERCGLRVTAGALRVIAHEHRTLAQQLAAPVLAKHQPCGCVICTCEAEQQCQGCGAKHCGNRADHPPYVGQQTAAVDGADMRDAERYRFLRDNNGVRNHHGVEVFIAGEAHAPGHLDAQVDAALAAQQGGGSDE